MSDRPSGPAEIVANVELERPTLEAGGALRGRVTLSAQQRCRCVELRLTLRWTAWGQRHESSSQVGPAGSAQGRDEAAWPTEIEGRVVAQYVLRAGHWRCDLGDGLLDGEPEDALDLVDAHPYRDGADQGAVAADGALEVGPRDLALRFAFRAPTGPVSFRGRHLRVTWRLDAHARTEHGLGAEARCAFDLTAGAGEPYSYGVAPATASEVAPFRGGRAGRGMLVLAIALGLPVAAAPALLGSRGLWLGAALLGCGLVLFVLALRARRRHALLSRARARPTSVARAGEPVEVCVQAPVALPVRGFTITLEQVERLPAGFGSPERRAQLARADVPHERLEVGDAVTDPSELPAQGPAARRRLARGGWLLTARVGLPPDLPPTFLGQSCAHDWQLRVALRCGVRPEPWTHVPLVVAPARPRPTTGAAAHGAAWGGVGGTTGRTSGSAGGAPEASEGAAGVVELVPIEKAALVGDGRPGR